jgi:hypothetical protein
VQQQFKLPLPSCRATIHGFVLPVISLIPPITQNDILYLETSTFSN